MVVCHCLHGTYWLAYYFCCGCLWLSAGLFPQSGAPPPPPPDAPPWTRSPPSPSLRGFKSLVLRMPKFRIV